MLAAVAVPFPLPSLRKVSFSRIVIVAVDALGVSARARSHRAGGAVVAAEGEAEGAEDRAASEVSRVRFGTSSDSDSFTTTVNTGYTLVWSNGLNGQSSCGPDFKGQNCDPSDLHCT